MSSNPTANRPGEAKATSQSAEEHVSVDQHSGASGGAKGLSGALTRFRVMAFVTGVVLATMTVIGLPYAKLIVPDGQDPAAWYSFGWMAHGWLYIAYVAVTLDLVFRLRWHVGRALLIILAGTIPFMSFVAERYVTRKVDPIIAERAASEQLSAGPSTS